MVIYFNFLKITPYCSSNYVWPSS